MHILREKIALGAKTPNSSGKGASEISSSDKIQEKLQTSIKECSEGQTAEEEER